MNKQKTPLKLFKPKATQTKTPPTIDVGVDVFGNAIPETKLAQVEGTGKALRIVKRQEITVKPSRKRKPKATTASQPKALAVAKPSLLGRLLPSAWTKPTPDLRHDGVAERLEHAFKRLHHEFNAREQQLELKMQALHQQHALLNGTRQKRLGLMLSLGAVGMLAGGYMLYVLTNMQNSMTAMSGNITTMNGHMGAMAQDTQQMTQNIQNMDASMYYMNGNVAQMNQKVGTLAQAAAPMGEAASTMSPFMKAFKSFMPF